MRRRLDWLQAGVVVAMLVLVLAPGAASWLIAYPAEWVVPITLWLNVFMSWCVDLAGPACRALSAALGVPMTAVRELLNWLPWSVTLTLATFVAWAASGWRLAAFTFFAILYMVVIGYWSESMNSLALVAISVPAAVGIGFALGALAFVSRRAERIITPTLDLLQTVPAFAYLLPILLLFGFGPVVGMIASVLYAFPPTVRNTRLGLARVPPDGRRGGADGGRHPEPALLAGPHAQRAPADPPRREPDHHGGVLDGDHRLDHRRDGRHRLGGASHHAQGALRESLLAGIVIALMAMVMDRITAAAASAEPAPPGGNGRLRARHRNALIAVGLALGVALLASLLPFLGSTRRLGRSIRRST